jgi:uncharacterized protein (TIRG00374 family)
MILFLKLTITLALSAYIVYHVKIEDLKSIIRNANFFVLFIAFILLSVNVILSAKKWQILLKIHNIIYSLLDLTKFYLIGGFFNNFLPSTIGGDSYRIYKTLNNSASNIGAVLSVFTERIFGLVSLLLLGFIASIVNYLHYGDKISHFGISFGAIGFLCLSIVIWILSLDKPRRWIFERPHVPMKLKNLILHIGDYRSNIPKFMYFLIVSFGFNALLFVSRYALIRSFGEECPILVLAMVTMISNVLATLPFSLNGIGILEGSFIFLITEFGLGYEAAMMTIVSERLLTIIFSLFGGILFYAAKDKNLPADEAANTIQPGKMVI